MKSTNKTWYWTVPAGAMAAVIFFSACERGEPDPATADSGGRPVVYASVEPLAHLVEQLAGDRMEVRAFVREGRDPHSFSPQPKELVELGKAAAFFVIGMPYEETLVSKLSSTARRLRIVDVTGDIEKLQLDRDHHHHEHEHRKEDAHENEHEHRKEDAHENEHEHHGDDDPHVWLSPKLLARQADLITHVLEELDPGQEEHYHAALKSVLAEIDALDRELSETLLPLKGQTFYAYHGAFGYFARDYHLRQESIEIGGRSPTPRRIVELIENAKNDGVRVIFVQTQFDQKSARTIAEAIGGTVVEIDPLEKDVFANLRRLGKEIGKALAKDS